MRAKFKEREEVLPSVTLSRDDLEHILSLFRGTCDQVLLSDKTHEYDSLDEVVAQVGAYPKELSFIGTRPSLTLNFLFGGSKILYAEVGDRREGEKRPGEDLYFRLRDFLSTRKHFMAKLPGYLLILGLIVLGILGIAASLEYPKNSYMATALGAVGILVAIGGGMLSSYVWGTAHLSLAPKGSETSFWARNKDKMILIGVGAVVSEIIHLVSAFIKK